MSLSIGTRLGPYEILAPLGAGGMGEVYRARDSRLGREVAIKVLPHHLSSSPEVRARFEREARIVSSLNHPHICVLHDVGRENGTDYLVMELVEGETLAARLQRGPLPAAELLRLGAQIADALDRAHRAGVVHRDLKPGNVMVTRAGAKLMDFGLARLGAPVPGGAGSGAAPADLTQSPTLTQPLTAQGTMVGTFQYMSPEQLEGREADARSDIWALGCVLYEMATGRRAFEGRSQASLIAAILERQPAPIAEAPSGAPAGGAPPGLDGLIRDCLAKDPDERIQTAHDVRLRLQRVAEGAGLSGAGARPELPAAQAAPPSLARGGRGAAAAWGLAGAVLGAGALLLWAWPRLTAEPPVYRFSPNTDPAGALDAGWPRISPDGRSLLFQANDSSGAVRAWLLRLDDTRPHPIPGSEGLARAYWSPDGREIAFVEDQKLLRLPVAGGTPTIVCPAPGGSDVSWGAKGLILLDGAITDSLRIVPAAGGELRPATRITRADHETGTAWPCFLPDGEHFLFLGMRSGSGRANLRLGRIGSLDSKLLGETDGRAEFAPGGWVLYVRGSSLVAQKLDLGAGRLTGEVITIADDLRIGDAWGHFSVSRDGVLTLERFGGDSGHEVHVVDRQGHGAGPALVVGALANPHFSPDGRRVLYERKGPVGTEWGDVYVFDLDRGTDTRLTFTEGRALRSQWSPDGRRIAYTRASGDGAAKLVIASADGLGQQDSVAVPGNGAFLSQWAADRLVYFSVDRSDFAVPAGGGARAPRPLADSTTRMASPQVSPDGRWVAGVAVDAADVNVFVQSLEGPPGRWQISSAPGGLRPVWTKGGRELVYEGMDGRLMAADIDTRSGFHAGTPHALFPLPVRSYSRELGTWACDERGERFLVITPSRARAAGRPVEVVTRFASLVERR